MAGTETMGPFSILLSVYVPRQSASPVSPWLLAAVTHRHTHVHRHTHISDLPGWTRACTHPHSRFAFCHTSTYHVPCRLRAPRQSLCMRVCLKERKTEGVRPHVCVWVNEDEWMNGLLLDLLLMTLFWDAVFHVRKHQSCMLPEASKFSVP